MAAAVAIALYLPTLWYGFLNWDDNKYVLENPWIRGWSLQNLGHIFTQPYYFNFLPLHLVSYMVDFSLWGLEPFGYHLQSVLLHALNAALALVVVRRLFGGSLVPFLAALLFAVHPSHVEAVAWISIRKDLLATAFALLSVYLYLVATAGPAPRWLPYSASVLCFGLSLLSKVTVAALPAFLLVLDLVGPRGRPRRPWRALLLDKVPYGIIGLVLVGLNTLAQSGAQAAYGRDAMQHLVVKGHAVWGYLGLLTGVLRGSPDYDLPVTGRDLGAVSLSIASLALLPVGALIASTLRLRSLALGLAWILVGLLPALVFPLAMYMADRYLYFASLGFCWIVAEGIGAVGARVPGRIGSAVAVATLTLLVAGSFTARAVQYLPVWRDSDSLWSYAITRSGDFRAYTNLAEVRLQQGRWEEAERLLRISARVENPTTYQNLGVLYYRQGRYAQAADVIERALAVLRRDGWDPEQASVLYYSLGAACAKLGQPARTLEALEAAIRENPGNEPARRQLELLRPPRRGGPARSSP